MVKPPSVGEKRFAPNGEEREVGGKEKKADAGLHERMKNVEKSICGESARFDPTKNAPDEGGCRPFKKEKEKKARKKDLLPAQNKYISDV